MFIESSSIHVNIIYASHEDEIVVSQKCQIKNIDNAKNIGVNSIADNFKHNKYYIYFTKIKKDRKKTHQGLRYI